MNTIIPKRRPTKHDPSLEESLAGHVWRATNIAETPTKKMPRPQPETSPLPKLTSGSLQDTPPSIPIPPHLSPRIAYHIDKKKDNAVLKAVQNAIVDAMDTMHHPPTHIYLSDVTYREYQYQTTNIHMASRYCMTFINGLPVRIAVSYDPIRFSMIPDSLIVCAFD